MRKLWTSCLLLYSTASCLFAESLRNSCWSIDNQVVRAGGCVTISLDGACKELRGKSLQIDENEPVPLERFGPSYAGRNSPFPGRESTLLLVFVDLLATDGIEAIPGEQGGYRVRPIFSEPGKYALTLRDGDVSLGTKSVTVLPCPKEAEAAVRILSPRVGKKQPTQDDYLWFQLIMSPTTWAASPLSEREMQVLRDRLPILEKHPDWAELAEMRLATLEVNHYIAQNTEDDESGTTRIKLAVERPSLPRFVTERLQKKPGNRFAEAAQDDITASVSLFEHLMKQREQALKGDRQ